MSGFYKKAVVWLGLNEEYPEDLVSHEQAPARPNPRPEPSEQQRREQTTHAVRPQSSAPLGQPAAAARPLDPAPMSRATQSASEGAVRAIPMEDDNASRSDSSVGTVRAVVLPKTVKPKVIVPQSFNDAQVVADNFREPKPVIVNMQNAERDLARRLIDFCSGLCYGLDGRMEKVAKDVYLLTPDDIEVADEDRENF